MYTQDDKVSIVVPIYNMEKYLSRCVDSLLQQTYDNIEIILVDDGSTDESGMICKEYESKYPNIYAILKENGGVSTARNAGLTYATGDWLMFVDPDDYLRENAVEMLLSYRDQCTEIIICTCTAVMDDREVCCHFYAQNREFATPDEKKELFKQLMDMSYGQNGDTIYTAIGVPWGRVYKRDFLVRNNLRFHEKLRRNQDNLFNIYAFYYAQKVKYIDEPLYMYNYEHMSSYFNIFRPNYAELFISIRKEKYKALKELKLLDDIDLYEFYVNETIKNEATILKQGIFHKENPMEEKEKRNLAKQVRNMECFNVYLNTEGFRLISSIKYKAFWVFLKLNLYRLIEVASQVK